VETNRQGIAGSRLVKTTKPRRTESSVSPGFEYYIGLANLLMHKKTHNDRFCRPRPFGPPAGACPAAIPQRNQSALRRSFSR